MCVVCQLPTANCKVVNIQEHSTGIFQCSCSDCLTGKFSRCGCCHLVPHCSKECQLEDWSYHKKLCKNLAQRSTTPCTIGERIFCDIWDMAHTVSIPLPYPLPNVEIVWIDAYLTNLLMYKFINIQSIKEKEGDNLPPRKGRGSTDV